jgi:hypothetical protein
VIPFVSRSSLGIAKVNAVLCPISSHYLKWIWTVNFQKVIHLPIESPGAMIYSVSTKSSREPVLHLEPDHPQECAHLRPISCVLPGLSCMPWPTRILAPYGQGKGWRIYQCDIISGVAPLPACMWPGLGKVLVSCKYVCFKPWLSRSLLPPCALGTPASMGPGIRLSYCNP